MKYFGKVGYAIAQEDPIGSGIWVNQITEEEYYGDITRDIRRRDSSDKVNDDLNISNTISILASPYALTNFQCICYVQWLNAYWKVSNIEVQPPRLILSLGGVYNGPVAASSQT